MTVKPGLDEYHMFEPRVRKGIGDRMFESCAPRLYNLLPTDLKAIPELDKFKKQLKTFLFERYYDELNMMRIIN